MASAILTGDARDLLPFVLADGCVQTCITSPPYYDLRNYNTSIWVGGDDECEHLVPQARNDIDVGFNKRWGNKEGVKAQEKSHLAQFRGICDLCGATSIKPSLGNEASPVDYVRNLVEILCLVQRVLSDKGTLWLNLGDCYAKKPVPEWGLKVKDMMGIPWRVAMALQTSGWYLRSDVIWKKPNPMPTSIKDRLTPSHEHIFLLAKSPSYYFDFESIMEERADFRRSDGSTKESERNRGGREDGFTKPNNLVLSSDLRRKRDVWSIPEELQAQFSRWLIDHDQEVVSDVWTVSGSGKRKEFHGKHLATFPPSLIEPCVLAGSARGGLILDIFAGSGTTGVVAKDHGRDFVGVELNPEYALLARQRIDEHNVNAPVVLIGG